MKISKFLVVLSLVLLSSSPCALQSHMSVADGSYTVCQNFKGTFRPDSVGRNVDNVGPPGKRGAKGDKGSLGNVKDSEVISKLANVLAVIRDCRGIYREGFCYFMPRELRVLNRASAENECRKAGGVLAGAQTREVYGAIARYAYDSFLVLQSQTYAQFWIDGIYQDGEITLTNGEKQDFVLWYPGYPRSGAGEIYMAFEIKTDHLHTNQHMFNINGSHGAYVLCQKSFDRED